MNILLIHQNFPGQFKHIALDLLREGKHRLLALCEQSAPGVAGIPARKYKLDRANTKGLHPYVVTIESGVIRGQAAARLLLKMRSEGYRPDLVLAHPGWGEALFVKDIFPSCRLISFLEFFYHSTGADSGFDPATPVTVDDWARIRIRNALHLLNLEACDVGVSPTEWQRSLHPISYRSKIRLVHEGIDTSKLAPDKTAVFTLPNGSVVKHGDPVITYVARNLEPYRGFIPFMHAVRRIVSMRPSAQVVVVGGDGVSYGSRPTDAANWRLKMTQEAGLDNHPNVHFTGKIPYDSYASLLRVSRAHIYLTYPFVLSWSMLEAMSSGALIIASATPPVQEVIENGRNGLLVDFFDVDEIAERAIAALDGRVAEEPHIREAARATVVDRYGVAAGVAGYRKLLKI